MTADILKYEKIYQKYNTYIRNISWRQNKCVCMIFYALKNIEKAYSKIILFASGAIKFGLNQKLKFNIRFISKWSWSTLFF